MLPPDGEEREEAEAVRPSPDAHGAAKSSQVISKKPPPLATTRFTNMHDFLHGRKQLLHTPTDFYTLRMTSTHLLHTSTDFLHTPYDFDAPSTHLHRLSTHTV